MTMALEKMYLFVILIITAKPLHGKTLGEPFTGTNCVFEALVPVVYSFILAFSSPKAITAKPL